MYIFKQLKIVYIVMAASQVIYFLVSLMLIIEEEVQLNENYGTIWGFIVPMFVVIMVVTSKLLYNRTINSNVNETSEEQKINIYKTANIIKFALLEGANILSVTFYLFTGDFLYAGMFIIVLGIFLINLPGKERFQIEFGMYSDVK